jgi:hypothetical protein
LCLVTFLFSALREVCSGLAFSQKARNPIPEIQHPKKRW